jgi:hypothetical protein
VQSPEAPMKRLQPVCQQQLLPFLADAQATAQLSQPLLQLLPIRADKFRSGRRRRRTLIRHEVGDGEVDFVADR